MPSVRKNPKVKGQTPLPVAQAAVKLVLEQSYSIRKAARLHNMNHATLHNLVKKIRSGGTPTLGYNPHTRVFSADQEEKIVSYLLSSSEDLYGLSSFGLRKLAYLLAVKHKVEYPKAWNENKIASQGWCKGFLRRHPNLSLRTRQQHSTTPLPSLNRETVTSFFDELYSLMEQHQFLPQDIYNFDQISLPCTKSGLDEAGNDILQNAAVTIAVAVNAVGNSVPPMFLYPTKLLLPAYLHQGPPGGTGLANGSGVMTNSDFLDYLKHFSTHSKPNLQQKVLLILSHHYSPYDRDVTDYCDSVGIVLLTEPPDATQKLQPLDRSIFGPLRTSYTSACSAWLASNHASCVPIDSVAEIVAKALPRAATPLNIIDGFKTCGIFPLDRDIFPKEVFMDVSLNNENVSSRDDQPQESAVEESVLLKEEVVEEILYVSLPSSPQSPASNTETETKYQFEDTVLTDRTIEDINMITEQLVFEPEKVALTPICRGITSTQEGSSSLLLDVATGRNIAEQTRSGRERKTTRRAEFLYICSGTKRGRGRGRSIASRVESMVEDNVGYEANTEGADMEVGGDMNGKDPLAVKEARNVIPKEESLE